ncbi:MAG: hypothetical protein LBQ09_11165, partial [Acidobacteriaceae bacterium]|nr:hypothetical protein [Acidobacteriaceae bacterium]
NTFFKDGSKGTDYNYIRDALGRATYQLSRKVKISGQYDRVSKYRGHDMQALTTAEQSSVVWTSPNYSTGNIKMTSPITNRLLFDAGWAFNIEKRNQGMQPGIAQDRGTPAWYAGAGWTLANGAGTVANSTTTAQVGAQWPERYSYSTSLSYITGSHNIKVGLNGTYGSFYHSQDMNADLYQEYANVDTTGYLNGTGPLVYSNPVSVVVYNTPLQGGELLSKDMGIYLQDTWRLRRMTVSAGIRYEWLISGVQGLTAPAGRFVPARTAPALTDVPNWADPAPRFQVIYDLFGNSKTAIKYSANRYNAGETQSIASGFNPLRIPTITTARLPWVDKNGDNIAEGSPTFDANGNAIKCDFVNDPTCEIDMTNLPPNFGQLSATGTYGGFPRQYSIEQGIEVQHELLPRLSVTGSYYYGIYRNLTNTINRNQTPADFTAVQVFNPVNGTPLTVYNQNGAAPAINNYTFVDPTRKSVFDSSSAEFRLRAGRGATFFGGMTWDRSRTRNCTVGLQQNPNSLQYCDTFNLENGDKVPYAKNVRLNGSYPLPWYGLIVSGTFQSNDGGALPETWTLTKTTKYPDGTAAFLAANVPVPACPAPCTPGAVVIPALTQTSLSVALRPSSSARYERLNQLDLKIGKTFKVRGVTFSPNLEAFNLTNTDMVITYSSTSYAIAGGSYLKPNSIIQGRIIGIGTAVRW